MTQRPISSAPAFVTDHTGAGKRDKELGLLGVRWGGLINEALGHTAPVLPALTTNTSAAAGSSRKHEAAHLFILLSGAEQCRQPRARRGFNIKRRETSPIAVPFQLRHACAGPQLSTRGGQMAFYKQLMGERSGRLSKFPAGAAAASPCLAGSWH